MRDVTGEVQVLGFVEALEVVLHHAARVRVTGAEKVGLLASAGKSSALPVIVGRATLVPGQPRFLALQRIANGAPTAEELDTYREVTADRAGLKRDSRSMPLLPAYRVEDLPRVFAEADRHFRELRERVTVETPDPFLNAAVAALNIAVDAVWDEPQGAVMHGAIAWRSKLLGWRGPYAQDALGWHDRARQNFETWIPNQNTDAIPPVLPPGFAARFRGCVPQPRLGRDHARSLSQGRFGGA